MTSLYDLLLTRTGAARAEFLSIPLIGRALAGDVSRPLYLDFLHQAYHHVRHTCPLLSVAADRTDDAVYRDALHAYFDEERGHDQWILSDIAAMGGDADAAAATPPRAPCRDMVGYAYFAVEWVSPYALLGMVHVLEGMSTLLATRAADALRAALGAGNGAGFSYLTSHGTLDVGHTGFFRDLVNRLDSSLAADAIIDSANMVYWLYGNIFRDLDCHQHDDAHAARG